LIPYTLISENIISKSINTSELHAEDYKCQLHNETRKTVRAKKQIGILQERLQTSEAEALLYETPFISNAYIHLYMFYVVVSWLEC